MKNLWKLIGNLNRAHSAKVPLLIISVVAIMGFSMTACGDDNDDTNNNPTYVNGVTVTIGIDKVDSSTFTVSIEGAKWKSSGWGSTGYGKLLFAEASQNITVDGTFGGGSWSMNVSTIFSGVKTSDTLLTFTVDPSYSATISSGTVIALSTESGTVLNNYTNVEEVEDLGNNKYRTNTCVVNSAKASITF